MKFVRTSRFYLGYDWRLFFKIIANVNASHKRKKRSRRNKETNIEKLLLPCYCQWIDTCPQYCDLLLENLIGAKNVMQE